MSTYSTADAHRIQELDDSGFSSVLVCSCGESFLGLGAERRQQVIYFHARHIYDESIWHRYNVHNGGSEALVPNWDDYKHIDPLLRTNGEVIPGSNERRGGRPLERITCKLVGCQKPHHAKGLCRTHYLVDLKRRKRAS